MTERSVKIKSSIYQKQEGRRNFSYRFANGRIKTANCKLQTANYRSSGNVVFGLAVNRLKAIELNHNPMI
jgi:hypothetical protein